VCQCCKLEEPPHHPKVVSLSPERRNMKHGPLSPQTTVAADGSFTGGFATNANVSITE